MLKEEEKSGKKEIRKTRGKKKTKIRKSKKGECVRKY